MPEIILLNTKDDDHFYPRSDPISYDELSVDYSVGTHLHNQINMKLSLLFLLLHQILFQRELYLQIIIQ